MQKRNRRILLLMLLVCALALPVMAGRTVSVNIDVELLDNGDALVREKRVAEINEFGTEGYISIFNLRRGMSITDLSVSDETGEKYEFEKVWNTERTRDEKKNRCGYNYTENGVELCWGIGDEGERTYYINYRIVGLVMGYDESDGFNHCFFSTDANGTDEVKVKIFRKGVVFKRFDPKVWMFRCYGNINVVDGLVDAHTTERISGDEMVVVMLEFPKGEFHPDVNVTGSFKSNVKDIALAGSTYEMAELENNTSLFEHISRDSEKWLLALGGIISLCLTIFVSGAIVFDELKRKLRLKKLLGGSKKNIMWRRDIPLNGDLLKSRDVYSIIEESSITDNDVISAYTLRLMLQKDVVIRRLNNADGSGYKYVLLINQPVAKAPKETLDRNEKMALCLHQLFYEAAGEDHILEINEIQLYFKRYPVEYREKVREIYSLLHESNNINLFTLTCEEVRSVMGFDRFLREFTLLSERDLIETMLWKEYMVFATMFGVAGRVRKELRKLLPKVSIQDYETL